MIDIRVSLFPDGPASSLDWGDSANRLRAQMRAAGITAAMVQGRRGSPASDPLGINPILRLATHVAGLHAVGTIDPTRTSADQIRRAEEVIQAGKVRALALGLDQSLQAPSHQPYLELAAKYDLPVIALPMLVEDAALAYPDVRFVLSPIRCPSLLMHAADVVARNENVWADLSGLISGDESMFAGHFDARTPVDHLDDLILDARKAFRFAGKTDRFLFGSGWPMAPIASYRTLVERIIPLEHHQAVFDTNARSLFRLG